MHSSNIGVHFSLSILLWKISYRMKVDLLALKAPLIFGLD